MDTQNLSRVYLNFVACWFGMAAVALLFCLTLLIYLSTEKQVQPQNHNFKLYAALPESTTQTVDNITPADGRAKIVENFFKAYGSLLSDYDDNFIKVADKYKLDYRWLPAIAMQESLGGKKVIRDSYNPFGYGIYGSLVVKFSSWEEAIERVGKALREDYLNHGLNTPEKVMAKYTPPSLAKGGIWAKGVRSFMEELR